MPPYFDPCGMWGHAYIHGYVTTEGHQVMICTRCGQAAEHWTSTNAGISAPSPGRGGSA